MKLWTQSALVFTCPLCGRLRDGRPCADILRELVTAESVVERLRYGQCGTPCSSFRHAVEAEYGDPLSQLVCECAMESAREAGIAGGMYELSDEEMVRRIRKLRRGE